MIRSKLTFALACSLAAPFVSAPVISAQKQATTLVALTARTPLVLRVRVQNRDIDAERVQLRLSLVESLRGTPTVPLVLQEIRARHCGSACHGLDAGAKLILFGSERDGRLYVRGGARGLVHETPERLAAIRALLGAKDATTRTKLVVDLLGERDPRLVEDASLALPTLPGLEKLDATSTAKVTQAIQKALKSPSVRLYGLLLAGARATPVAAATTAWTLWYDDAMAGWHGLAREVLVAEVSPSALGKSFDAKRLDARQRERSAALFFGTKPEAVSDDILRRLASDSVLEVRVEAVAALLSRAGSTTPTTRIQSDKDTLDRAKRLVEKRQSATERFRAIRPGLKRRNIRRK